eukprot:10357101-Alexandrium_andersonii.AAC.1
MLCKHVGEVGATRVKSVRRPPAYGRDVLEGGQPPSTEAFHSPLGAAPHERRLWARALGQGE